MTQPNEEPDWIKFYFDVLDKLHLPPHIANEIWPSFWYYIGGGKIDNKIDVSNMTFEQIAAMQEKWQRDHQDEEKRLDRAIQELKKEIRFH